MLNFRYIISGLDASTEYDVFLQPFYGTVVGLPTSISSIKTKTQQILRKTEILVAEMINVTTAFIVWQGRQPSHGITGYQVLNINHTKTLLYMIVLKQKVSLQKACLLTV